MLLLPLFLTPTHGGFKLLVETLSSAICRDVELEIAVLQKLYIRVLGVLYDVSACRLSSPNIIFYQLCGNCFLIVSFVIFFFHIFLPVPVQN